MPTYEKVVDGRVVETVTPVEGDHEDTRLGCAVLDAADGWRLADPAEVLANSEEPQAARTDPAPESVPTVPAEPENTTEDPDGTDPAAGSDPPARRGHRSNRR